MQRKKQSKPICVHSFLLMNRAIEKSCRNVDSEFTQWINRALQQYTSISTKISRKLISTMTIRNKIKSCSKELG